MWRFLDRLARPSLAQQLRRNAQVFDEQSLMLLGGPQAKRAEPWAFLAAAAGSEACWQALRANFGDREWRRVRDNLREHRRLLASQSGAAGACPSIDADRPADWLAALAAHARTQRQARAMERLRRRHDPGRAGGAIERAAARRLRVLLAQRADWLTDAAAATADEAVLRRGLVRVFVKARRHLQRAPRSARARRWLAHQVRVLEAFGVGLTGPLGTASAGARQLDALLAEDVWLRALVRAGNEGTARVRGLVQARRRELRGAIEMQTERALSRSPEELTADLHWACFVGFEARPPTLPGG
jgi:hypothetical protein